MSHTDTLRDGYEAFGRGDLEAASANFSDGIRWENPEYEGVPNSGVTEGKDGVISLFAEVPDNWAKFTITPDEFIEQGDTVVVLSHGEVEGKDSGKSAKLPWVHIWRFEGDHVVEVQALTDTALAAEALGTLG